MKRLAIITSHPVQYYAPLFRALSAVPGLVLQVFYTWGESSVTKFDPGFGKVISWDIPVLDGYSYRFLHNTAKEPGTSRFRGIINPGIITEVDAFNPDALLVYGWAWQSHLKVLRHYAGRKPVWFRGDSTLLDATGGLKSLARNLLLRWVYRHVDKAFYVGAASRAYFTHYGLSSDRLCWAPHAVDNQRFGANRSAEAAALRAEMGIPADARVVLFAGKLEPKKRPDQLLQSFCQLNLPGTHLVFAGNGVLEYRLKATAANHPRVHFLPFVNQSQMPALYQACQLFCLPSQGPGETWGLAVNEAMAAGKAVLVSDKVGCAVDLVKEGVNGALFKAGNQEALTEKLEWLLRPGTDLEAMGRQSAALIRPWSFDAQVAAIASEIESI